MVSPLAKSIYFLEDLGFFDIILPFLLTFVIVYAVLEKTKILGKTEKDKPKTNVNAMLAFVVALFVVATKQITDAFKISLPWVVLILLAILMFMMLAGVVFGDKEFTFEENKGWRTAIIIIAFIAIIAIFLHGFGWLEPFIGFIIYKWADTLIMGVVLLFIIIGTILIVVGKKPKEEKGGE
jgi:glucan phosphoethanolaminetransferase (alkaline phosphatase superfamily)